MAQESWIKRVLPRGLYGRAALILVLPVLSVTMVVSVAFIQRHFDRVSRQMTTSAARDLALVLAQVDQAPDLLTAVVDLVGIVGPLELEVALPASEPVVSAIDFFDFSGRVVVDELRRNLPALTAVDLDPRTKVLVGLESRHGPIAIGLDRSRLSAANPHQLLVLMGLTSLLTSAIAFLFLRNQLRPIRRLARAAEGFGRGRSVPFKPAGATEVRAAATAFLDMRQRIERQIEQRTLMLSGVSHDLRTPLTRLRLGLGMLSPDMAPDQQEIDDLIRDVDDMGSLVDAFLDFSRDMADTEASVPVPVVPFLTSLVEDAVRAGQDVTLGPVLDGVDPMNALIEVPVRAVALRRAVGNLVNNAVRYGSKARLGAVLGSKSLVIWVEDDGPGIPEDAREEALRPFTRLDPSRNQDKGQGVGLGLSIAMDAARAHGGHLRLVEGTLWKGLRAEIVLPR